MTSRLISPSSKSAQPAVRGECRIYERHACELETSCQTPAAWYSKDMKWRAQVRDISQGGLGLVLHRRFEPGAGLAVELPGSDPDEPSKVLVRVVRVSAQEDGSWLLGCAFISHLSEEEVQELIRAATGADVKEEPCRPVQLAGVDLEAVLPSGKVLRRRFKKLSVSDAWPVPVGAWFLLRTTRAPAEHRGLRLRVDSCSQNGQRWVLRCSLHAASSADVTLVLGESRR